MKALWNALRGRHKYCATNRNQYAAWRCSMITSLTRNSIGTGSSPLGSSNFWFLHLASRLLSRSDENKNFVTMRQCGHCLHKEGGSVVKALWRWQIQRNKWKSICHAGLLNDNAPDSELSDMSSSPLGSSNFWFLHNYFTWHHN